jgi:hypothetical protein
MPFIMRRSGRSLLLGFFFFFFFSLYSGGTWPVPCCRAFLLPARPTAAPRRRQQQQHQQHQRQLKAPITSLSLMPPSVDLITQSTTTDAAYYVLSIVHSNIIGTTDLLLGTDATLHHMANVMDPSTTTTATAQLLALPDSIGDVAQASAAASTTSSAPGALSPTTTVLVFVAGLIPFAVATVEFWRRVTLQLPFGTGGSKDQSVLIVIGDDNDRQLSRGRRVLGKNALLVAIVLFGVAASAIAIVVASVLTSTPPPPPPGAY